MTTTRKNRKTTVSLALIAAGVALLLAVGATLFVSSMASSATEKKEYCLALLMDAQFAGGVDSLVARLQYEDECR